MSSSSIEEYTIIIAGTGGVGKSALTIQFMENRFVTDYNPTIEDCFNKRVTVDGVMTSLKLLDTAGQEEYTVLREQNFIKANGFLLVYSVADKSSFESIPDFYKKILSYMSVGKMPMVLCGNKCDLPIRVISKAEGAKLSESLKVTFMETSAKDRTNVDEAFYVLVRLMRKGSGQAKPAGMVPDNPDYFKKNKKCAVM
eukprot:TRINITY_DN3256_c0_g2_i2.p1 TRINITY_DN3256_c0_g2~~TRINITY_DN3256_c0_g2_i2.p1  ORF type:complete len:198 (+),score=63.32 TRINITY_DN3256_c0_g2_i2:50-643(+)